METSAETISRIFAAHRDRVVERRKGFGYAQRREALIRLKETLLAHEQEMRAAMAADFGKPAVEVTLTELSPALVELNHTLGNLRKWMQPQQAPSGITFLGTSTKVHPVPKGVVLVIAPWNFPFTLTLGPIVSAIAAGCSVVVKPSEHTPNCSALMERMLATALGVDLVTFVHGGPAVGQALAALPFDHIFFTGSGTVGKAVMRAAAHNLTPVTLELGGKSPVIVGPDANIRDAARWVAWGRFMNAGQACVAPDHVWVHRSVAARFNQALVAQIKRMYGPAPLTSPDMAQIAHAGHFERLCEMLDDALALGADVVVGGECDANRRKIAPTVLANIDDSMRVATQEIFGPILPVREYEETAALLTRLNSAPAPLALYVFGGEALRDKIRAATQSGFVGGNIVVMPFAHPSAPFGGIGASGMGSAHGYAGFAAFSHFRPVITRRIFPFQVMFPPYRARTHGVLRVFRWLLQR